MMCPYNSIDYPGVRDVRLSEWTRRMLFATNVIVEDTSSRFSLLEHNVLRPARTKRVLGRLVLHCIWRQIRHAYCNSPILPSNRDTISSLPTHPTLGCRRTYTRAVVAFSGRPPRIEGHKPWLGGCRAIHEGFTLPLRLHSRFAPCSIFQELCVNGFWWELDISDNRATNEAVLHSHHVRMPRLVENLDVIEADVQKLIHRLQHTRDREVILEFDGDLLVREGFEH